MIQNPFDYTSRGGRSIRWCQGTPVIAEILSLLELCRNKFHPFVCSLHGTFTGGVSRHSNYSCRIETPFAQHGTRAKLRNFRSMSAIELQARSGNDKNIVAVNQTKLDHDVWIDAKYKKYARNARPRSKNYSREGRQIVITPLFVAMKELPVVSRNPSRRCNLPDLSGRPEIDKQIQTRRTPAVRKLFALNNYCVIVLELKKSRSNNKTTNKKVCVILVLILTRTSESGIVSISQWIDLQFHPFHEIKGLSSRSDATSRQNSQKKHQLR